MSHSAVIDSRVIGSGYPALVVAELSANHGGSLERALELIRLAYTAGADAIKLQTYRPDTMTIASDAPWFRIEGGPWRGRTLWELYEQAHTPWEWHGALFAEARRFGMIPFSTPFDTSAVDFLEQFDPPCYKIASFEVGDLALLRRVGQTGRPVILSTGMANLDELDEAIATLRIAGASDVIPLLCVSAYPAMAKDFKLRHIPLLAQRYGTPAGLSDHSAGHLVAVAACALGAGVIEKHLCRDRADGGPDASFSAEPHEFAELIRAVRSTESMLSNVGFGVSAAERSSTIFRRSLFVVRDIAEGERFTEHNVRVIRPGYGMAPRDLPEVLGRTAARAIRRGTPLSREMIDGDGSHAGLRRSTQDDHASHELIGSRDE